MLTNIVTSLNRIFAPDTYHSHGADTDSTYYYVVVPVIQYQPKIKHKVIAVSRNCTDGIRRVSDVSAASLMSQVWIRATRAVT